MPNVTHPIFAATGIGSLPHLDADGAVAKITGELTEMPYWPQLSKRAALEDMNLMFARVMSPILGADEPNRALLAHPAMSREEALAGFYEHLFGADLSEFDQNQDEARGFFAFMEAIQAAPVESFPWVKGHVTGPLTMSASVIGSDGKALLYDDEVAEAIARGLGVVAAAQTARLASLKRPVLMFVDEPFLSGFGSAFTPVSREKVISLLAATLEELRNRAECRVGIHCCGNTDWAMLIEAGFDVINLDSDGYGEGLLLYPEALKELYARGGGVAWGAVPTADYKGTETAPVLWEALKKLLDHLEGLGIDRKVLAAQSLITPSCGMGSLKEQQAAEILELTRQVSELAKEAYA